MARSAEATTRRDLPTGTVTFLFTDVEGSTSRLVELGDAYDGVLAAHAQRIRGAVAAHGGTEVNTEGDAFFVVFASAPAAIAAAAEAQRSLADGPWPDGAPLRVRMGLHTGEGRLGGDDYAGFDVNRAARIASAGHGGQVLLSEPTRALVEGSLPDGTTLRDLGLHRLKDLPRPEHLWQLEIEGLAADFPALRSLDARPQNLPASSPLIGRDGELASVRELLAAHRLVTLVGPGGTGKTRLALAVARALLDELADGVFLVRLEDTRDRDGVAAAIAAVLDIREQPTRSAEELLRSYLASREMLLVLDNFEQVIAAAPIVTELLEAAPGLRVLATSRAPLRVSDEREHTVPPLGVPDVDDLPAPEALTRYAAVALFVERARAVRGDFEVTPENAAAVAGITRRLDGLPLAIELAAARVRLLAPTAILERLEQSLPVLGTGGRDRPERQRTLRGAIDWSYDLLDEDERRVFDRLSIFAGGWTLEAAEAVALPGDGEGIDLLDTLASLAEKHLVRTVERTDLEHAPRFTMLNVIREYAAERLAADPAAHEEAVGRHGPWVRELVEAAAPELTGADMRRQQARLRVEDDNIRVALRRAIERGEADLALRIAGALWRYWSYWGGVRDGVELLEAVLSLVGVEELPEPRARALAALASLLYWQGRTDRAEELYAEVVSIRRALGDDHATAESLRDWYWTAVARMDVEVAFARLDEAVELDRRAGDEASAAVSLAWRRIAETVMGGGDPAAALEAAQEAAEISERRGHHHDMAEFRSSMGYILFMSRRFEDAHDATIVALGILRDQGNLGRLGAFFKFVAAIELELGRPATAARLAASARRYSERIGGEIGGGLLQVGDPLEDSRAQLTPDAWQRAVEKGRAMTLDDAIETIVSGREPG